MKNNKLALLIFSLLFFHLLFSGCKQTPNPPAFSFNRDALSTGLASFRDIPGITSEEILAIEELQRTTGSLVYGMTEGLESFVEAGVIKGFSVMVAEWLTHLLGIPVTLAIYDWSDLIEGLERGEIDFTGDLTTTEERRQKYYMTEQIARRSIKYMRMADSPAIQNIIPDHTPRYAFFDGSITKDFVSQFTHYDFDIILVDNYSDAYNILVQGDADAFFVDSTLETVFDIYDDVIFNDFIPIIGLPVSLSTQKPALAPVIEVVQKALDNGTDKYFEHLYNLGKQEHSWHRLYLRLTEEEREFLRSRPQIPYGAEFYNYPVSFYSARDKEWQGIFFEIIDELEFLTGLDFVLVNDQQTIFPALLEMLEAGEVYFISELLPSELRMGRFLWPEIPTTVNNYALLSRAETPNIDINEVFNMRVGVPKGTAYEELFSSWFPLHANTIVYETSQDAFFALDKGEVDLVMSCQLRLLALTNYYELSGYKAALVFPYMAESFMGFNVNQQVFTSIVNKALHLIDVKNIGDRWNSITFDYQARLLQAQRPWLIGAIILSAMVISLMTILFMRSRNSEKKLDLLVQKRTMELAVATETAKTANRSKSAFLANMSHEIRTPMNTILGTTEIMLQKDPLDKEIEEGLNKIYTSSDMLMGIINDILDFSKIEAGKLDIKTNQYYIASMINDSVQLNIMRIGDKPITFQLQIEENIRAKLIGDELRIKQILNNLLSNAFKYTEAGKVILSISFEDQEHDKNQLMLIMSVEDTGYGLTKEQIEKLFSEYARFSEGSSRNIEGTGLGMSITQRLIDLMDGEINIDSTVGKGTKVTVRLPQETVDSEILGAELAASLKQFSLNDISYRKRGQITRELMPYGKVLIVDDVEANIYVAEGLLKPYKLQIESVMSGEEAIQKIKEGSKYDIVFMDHMMPEMDGIETLKHLRDMGYKDPIVALTANAIAGQADIFFKKGFDDVISKPIDSRHLNTVLNKLIRDKYSSKKSPEKPLGSGEVKENDQEERHEIFSVSIDNLDIKKGLEKFDNDSETYLLVLRSYARSINVLLGLIENANEKILTPEGLLEYQRGVHSVKGTSLDIFAESIGKKARELEDAAKEKNIEFIKQENPAFLAVLKKLIFDIEEYLSHLDGKTEKPVKNKIETDLLSKLLSYCKEYDMNGVDSIMKEIEKSQYEADNDLSLWLRKNVDVVDFDAIAERIRRIQ